MAISITSCYPASTARSAELSTTSHAITMAWRVAINPDESTSAPDPYDVLAAALSSTSIPAIGSAHPTAPGTYLRSYTAEMQPRHHNVYIITGNYATAAAQSSTGSPDPAAWTWQRGASSSERPAYKGRLSSPSASETPITNAAGDPPSSPVMIPVHMRVYTGTRVANSYSPAMLECIGTINNTSITVAGQSIAARRGYCADVQVNDEWIGDTLRYRISVTIHALPTGEEWCAEFLNMGFMAIVDDAKKQITLADGTNPASPVLLADDGTYPTTTPNYRKYYVYPENSWSALSL